MVVLTTADVKRGIQGGIQGGIMEVYLAGYSGEVLIDNGGILSLFEEEGRAIEPRNWLLTLISATFF